ncbi:hypothetical protein [Novosphingopyxis sp. YJ-S2-01]|uniref:hypothetical protein n=1 Tax=Novosphingopyxis sp. YJ-S2-01 TaxID=2794021 RepID=UPI0018DDBA3A|nr:hypothetical protein [Novosphingopyxis sp. YJ-S2-01]MBH9537831.1 hypothetical protein [Novosphingopyxis sp. YJ-S2-01]
MRKILLTSAAILAFGSTAAYAQMQNDDMSSGQMEAQGNMAMQQQSPTMNPQQQAIYNGLTAEQKASFDSWDLQQKGLYFALNAEQRSQLWALPQAQRDQAWMQIRKAAGLPATPPAQSATGATASTRGTTGAMAGQGNNMNSSMRKPAGSMGSGTNREAMSGAAAKPPASAMNKDYPTCSRTVTDNCVNPGRK